MMKDNLKIFLLAGQSNMSGRGDLEDVDQIRNPHIMMFRDGEWLTAVEPLHTDKPDIAGVGLGMSFAEAILERHPDWRIGLVPCAVGGTPLQRWMTGADLYERAVSITRDALRGGILKGILWHQGEGDSGLLERASSYAERFTKMIASMRSDLGEERAPAVAGELGRFLKDYQGINYFEMVNRAFHECAGLIPLYGAASSEGLGDKGDFLHFDAVSLREFGRRYARVYCEIVAQGD